MCELWGVRAQESWLTDKTLCVTHITLGCRITPVPPGPRPELPWVPERTHGNIGGAACPPCGVVGSSQGQSVRWRETVCVRARRKVLVSEMPGNVHPRLAVQMSARSTGARGVLLALRVPESGNQACLGHADPPGASIPSSASLVLQA